MNVKSLLSKIKELTKTVYDNIKYVAPLIVGIIATVLSTIEQIKDIINA